MTWQYGIKMELLEIKSCDFKVAQYELCEIYDGEDYTESPIVIQGDSPQNIIEMLEEILKDLKEHQLIVEVE
jgi:hypothetical protein